MMLVCKDCGNEQEKINLGMRVSYKIIDGVSYYKTRSMKDWEVQPKDICEKCGSKNIEPPTDHYKNIAGHESGRRDPNSPMYWKRGKTNEQISKVLTGESNPY